MARALLKQNEVIVLLGAGASVEAGIPDSSAMVQQIEHSVAGDAEWQRFGDLYWYIRSSIHYADGLDRIVGDRVLFNIERLVNALDELRKKERHTLYPFVGAWNPKLLDVAGSEFEHVHSFRRKIVEVLRGKWLELPKKETADYYTGLLRFQREYEYPLRVFSLNYDLCVENACGFSNVQRGFEDRRWDWRLFDETSDDPAPLLLYKLHGSTDWKVAPDGPVTHVDAPTTIGHEEVALIFGTSYKLQYVDPFLFLAYELRRWTLDVARVIVTIGYGFGDEHINGILGQALRQDRERKLLSVTAPGTADEEAAARDRIAQLLQAPDSQVHTTARGASNFLQEDLSIDYLAALVPDDEDLIEELPAEAQSLG
jgi:hypothetical protein